LGTLRVMQDTFCILYSNNIWPTLMTGVIPPIQEKLRLCG
jgi:hypothetical protein